LRSSEHLKTFSGTTQGGNAAELAFEITPAKNLLASGNQKNIFSCRFMTWQLGLPVEISTSWAFDACGDMMSARPYE
jgi:hypothetical protein